MFVKITNLLVFMFIISLINIVNAGIISQTGERMKGKKIEIGLTSLPENLDPVNIVFLTHFLLLQCSTQTLVRVSETGQISSDLAEKWFIKENGTVYEFHLSEKAKFSNGKSVTANSVAYSLSRHFWKNSIISEFLKPLILGANNIKEGDIPIGIKIITDKVIQIKLNKAYPALLYVLAMPGFGVISKQDHSLSGPMFPIFQNNKWKFTANKNYSGPRINIKSIEARKVATLKEALDLFQSNELDLALGLPFSELENIKLPSNLKITKTESLIFVHLYYNNSKTIFKDNKFRKELSLLIQGISKKSTNLSRFQTSSSSFIPRGVMPDTYYVRSSETVSVKQFEAKWKGYVKGKSLKIVLVKKSFQKEFIEDLKITLTNLGINLELIAVVDPKILKEYMKSKDYDIIGGGYVGNFPDPDGFLNIIKKSSSLNYGVIPSNQLFEQIEQIRYLEDRNKRLLEYAKILKEFESNWYFVPLYRTKIPILHNKKLDIPESNFRYESELWKIFWTTDSEK